MAREYGEKMVLGLALMVIFGIIGFYFYQAVTGVKEISSVISIGIVGVLAFGIVSLGILSRETSWSFNNAIAVLAMIGIPIVVFWKFPNMLTGLFSTFGASGNVNIEINFTGTMVEFVRKYWIGFLIAFGLMAWKRETIVNWYRRNFK